MAMDEHSVPGNSVAERPYGRYASAEAAERARLSRKRSTQARNRAVRALVASHPEEYARLYSEALKEAESDAV